MVNVEKGYKAALKFVAYAFAKVVAGTILLLYFRVSVKDGGRLPKRGGALVAANHFSFSDPLILGSFLRRRLWFVMAEDQFAKPGVHLFSRLMDVVPVKAGVGFQLGSVRRCLTTLKHGHCVAIFPEGQRSRTGVLLPPMPGLGVLAARSGVPVVPVAIAGTREAYPPGVRLPRPRKVRLFVGEPLALRDGESPEDLATRTMDAIAALLTTNGFADYVQAPKVAAGGGQT